MEKNSHCGCLVEGKRYDLQNTKKVITAILSLLVVILFVPSPSVTEELNFIRIGTGGLSGVYYPIGKIIAHGLTGIEPKGLSKDQGKSGIPGFIGVAQNSAGSIDNVRGVVSGIIEAGLVQADVAFQAYHNQNVFKDDKRSKSVRAIASLYPEKFQIVVRQDAHIQSFFDLKGKRISLDEAGSGTLTAMRIVFDAHGMTEKDLFPVYLKPIFTKEKIISGELQGFVMMAGAPMIAVSQLLGVVDISLVPISPKFALSIQTQYPYLVPGLVPANTYPGIPETPTIQVHALLVVHESMEDSLVYQITEALWSRRTLSILRKGHLQGKAITPQTALKGLSIPLHSGANKYYHEHKQRFKDFQ